MPEMAVRTMPLMRMSGWMGPLCISHRNPPTVCRQSTVDTQGIYRESMENLWEMCREFMVNDSQRKYMGILQRIHRDYIRNPGEPYQKNTGNLEMIHRWSTENPWEIPKISTGSSQKMGNLQKIHGKPTVDSWGIYRSCMEDWQRICG